MKARIATTELKPTSSVRRRIVADRLRELDFLSSFNHLREWQYRCSGRNLLANFRRDLITAGGGYFKHIRLSPVEPKGGAPKVHFLMSVKSSRADGSL